MVFVEMKDGTYKYIQADYYEDEKVAVTGTNAHGKIVDNVGNKDNVLTLLKIMKNRLGYLWGTVTITKQLNFKDKFLFEIDNHKFSVSMFAEGNYEVYLKGVLTFADDMGGFEILVASGNISDVKMNLVKEDSFKMIYH